MARATGRFWEAGAIPNEHRGRWFVASNQMRAFRLTKLFLSNGLGIRWAVKRQQHDDGLAALGTGETVTSTFDITDMPLLSDRHFSQCNFTHHQAVDSGGGVMVGHRLFPAESTGITFDNCNLTNCEPPPGSTLNQVNAAIIVRDVVTSSDTITVDGEVITLDHHSHFVHARYFNGAYEYKPAPEELVID